MKTIKRFFLNLIRNPKTSAYGVAGLVTVGFAAAANPAILAQPETITAILGSAGLLVAADDQTKSEE